MQKPSLKPSIQRLLTILILATLMISALGYVDFITGEISIDVLYVLALCITTWYTGTLIGIICVVEIMSAKTAADFYDNIKIGSHLYEWNSLNYLVMYLVICVLVGLVKKTLSK